MAIAQTYIRDEKGNYLSFEQVYDLHFDNVFQHILRRVGKVAEAEDLTAITFEKAMKAMGRFRWRGIPISAWILRIATNQVNSFFRQMQRQATTNLQQEAPSSRLSPEQELEAAEQELAKNNLFQVLSKCIQDLPAIDQSIVVMRHLEGRSFLEIANILKKRRGTVITRSHRALAKLKQLLEHRGISDERFRKSLEEPSTANYSGGQVQTELAG